MNQAMAQLEAALLSRNGRTTLEAALRLMSIGLLDRSNFYVPSVCQFVGVGLNSKKFARLHQWRSSQMPSIDNNTVEAKGRSR